MCHLFLQGPRWRPSAQLWLSGEAFSSGMTQEKWNRNEKCGLAELGDQGSGRVGVTQLRSLSSMTNSANLMLELQKESMHNDVSVTEYCCMLTISLSEGLNFPLQMAVALLLNTHNSIGHNNRIHLILNLNSSGNSNQLMNSLHVKSFVVISVFWAREALLFHPRVAYFSSSLSVNPW